MQNYKLKGKYECKWLILLESKPDSNDYVYNHNFLKGGNTMKKETRYASVVKVWLLTVAITVFSCIFAWQSMAETKRFTSPAASPEWYAYCNKVGRNIVLGKNAPNNNHIRLSGPFQNEPAARNWVNKTCSSWRCNQNGRCITGGTNDGVCPPGQIWVNRGGTFGQGSGGYCRNK